MIIEINKQIKFWKERLEEFGFDESTKEEDIVYEIEKFKIKAEKSKNEYYKREFLEAKKKLEEIQDFLQKISLLDAKIKELKEKLDSKLENENLPKLDKEIEDLKNKIQEDLEKFGQDSYAELYAEIKEIEKKLKNFKNQKFIEKATKSLDEYKYTSMMIDKLKEKELERETLLNRNRFHSGSQSNLSQPYRNVPIDKIPCL